MKESKIIDGLSTVILFNVRHIQEAYRELKRFRSRAHAIPFTIICDSCQITKCKFPQILGERPTFYGSHNDTIGFWGEVTYEDGIVMFVI